MQLKGNVLMPKELESLLTSLGDRPNVTEDTLPESKESDTHPSDYLIVMRRADILMLCTFYGLYTTMELPPLQEDATIPSDGSYEFNVNIDREVELLRHILFLMWLSENIPESLRINLTHRKKLYAFLERILDDEFIVKVAIPFYLQKSATANGDVIFIEKLARSRKVPFDLDPYGPEAIALEYHQAKFDFESYIEESLDSFIHYEEYLE